MRLKSDLLVLVPNITYCWQEALAEGIGTFILVFAGTGSVIVNSISNGAVTHLGISFCIWSSGSGFNLRYGTS